MHSIPLGLCLDLDGTLVDSRSDIAAACNHALQALGRSPLPEAIVAGFVGDGARKLLSRALRTDQEPLLGEALLLFEAFYAAHPADHTTLLPGARELLERSPVPLALVTNKPRLATEQILEALGIRGFFRDIAAGGDAPLKPRPDLVQRALGGLGLEASNTWMVGDGPQDMGAGRAADRKSVV